MSKIGYVRVSRPDQNPESQSKLLQEMGINENLIFLDVGISGKIRPEDRPAFKKMVAAINESQGQIDEIVFSEFSRLGRTVEDSLLALLGLKRSGIKISSLSTHEKFINDLPSDLQPTVLSAMLYSATLERKHNNERTAWGLANARAKGKALGRPEVVVDFNKVKEIQTKYNLKEKQAVRVAGYVESTYYKKKREANGGISNDPSQDLPGKA